MKLENEAELGNTRKLLEELQEQIARAKSRPQTRETLKACNRSFAPPTNCEK